jgi:hypothetical protein
MDLDKFREPQSPWFFTQPPTMLVDIRNSERIPEKQKSSLPSRDNRYPGWAARMSDGRIVTDYRSPHELNIPTGTQLATRVFMQKNADSIISESRKRQAANAGAGLSYDSSTLMEADAYMKCSTDACKITPTYAHGVGIERAEGVPDLFGTFAESHASLGKPARPINTVYYEGGRNSIRGRT